MAASEAQRAAVAGRPCIVCGAEHRVDPAHLISRSLGGCGEPLCVVPLCRVPCHRAFDRGELDLLPYLEPGWRAQLAHAVGHVGLIGALRRIAGPNVAASSRPRSTTFPAPTQRGPTMTRMAAFPALAEPITVPVSKLAAATITDAGLADADYAVIEPVDDGVRVRPASIDEQLAYEQTPGLGHVTYSLDEFLADLDGDS